MTPKTAQTIGRNLPNSLRNAPKTPFVTADDINAFARKNCPFP
jgi:hypothetical protein